MNRALRASFFGIACLLILTLPVALAAQGNPLLSEEVAVEDDAGQVETIDRLGEGSAEGDLIAEEEANRVVLRDWFMEFRFGGRFLFNGSTSNSSGSFLRPSIGAGLVLELPLLFLARGSIDLGVMIDVLYLQKGWAVDSPLLPSNGELRLDYFTPTLFFKIRHGEGFKLGDRMRLVLSGGVGTGASFLLTYDFFDYDTNRAWDVIDNRNGSLQPYSFVVWNLSAIGGASLETPFGILSLDFRYDLDLLPSTNAQVTLDTKRLSNSHGDLVIAGGIRQSQFTAMLSYTIPIRLLVEGRVDRREGRANPNLPINQVIPPATGFVPGVGTGAGSTLLEETEDSGMEVPTEDELDETGSETEGETDADGRVRRPGIDLDGDL